MGVTRGQKDLHPAGHSMSTYPAQQRSGERVLCALRIRMCCWMGLYLWHEAAAMADWRCWCAQFATHRAWLDARFGEEHMFRKPNLLFMVSARVENFLNYVHLAVIQFVHIFCCFTRARRWETTIPPTATMRQLFQQYYWKGQSCQSVDSQYDVCSVGGSFGDECVS